MEPCFPALKEERVDGRKGPGEDSADVGVWVTMAIVSGGGMYVCEWVYDHKCVRSGPVIYLTSDMIYYNEFWDPLTKILVTVIYSQDNTRAPVTQ